MFLRANCCIDFAIGINRNNRITCDYTNTIATPADNPQKSFEANKFIWSHFVCTLKSKTNIKINYNAELALTSEYQILNNLATTE